MTIKFSLSAAFAGYAAAFVLILSGAAVAVRSLDASSADWLAALKAREERVTQAERLRWRNELHVAATRGVLITPDPSLRAKEQQVSDAVRLLISDLRRTEDDPRARELATAVERASAAYERAHHELMATGDALLDRAQLAERFERELMPLRRRLGDAIDAFMARQLQLVDDTYHRIERQRAWTRAAALGSLLLVAAVAAALFWFISRVLARTYARERGALARAEKALAARDEVLGIVAHDLRNPLSAIALHASVLQRSGELGTARNTAGKIERLAARMDRLIASLLDVASIEAGRLSTNPAVCEPEPLLREVLSTFEPAAAQKSVCIESQVQEASPIRADRERVLQVLSNLIGNAMKFTPAGGSIRLSAAADGDFVRFSVADSGPGIESVHIPHLFDRYWKKDGGTVKGTGLGLFICKGIVEAHGGRIWVESRPGDGAAFYFTLPRAA